MKPNARIRQLRKQKALQRRGTRKEKAGEESPKDPFQQLVDFANKTRADLNKLSQEVQLAVGQLYQNDQNTKLGLDAAEFNLRTHQKVINAIGLDLVDFTAILSPMTNGKKPLAVELLDTEIPQTESTPAGTTTSINWPKYHGYVEAEMKALAEEERKLDLVKRTEQVKDLEDSGKLQKFKDHIFETIEKAGEDKEARIARANAFFSDAYAQIALVKAGKEYSGAKLDVLLRMIADEEKRSAGVTTPKEEIGTLVDPPAEVDADTHEFGG
jgi:hypothetical protein